MPNDQIQIKFLGGPDESVDPRHVPHGSIIAATNQVYDADGAYGVRLGYTALGNAIGNLLHLSTFRGELLAVTDVGQLATYDGVTALWRLRDQVSPVGVTHRPAMSSTSSFQSWGSASAGGYTVVAWVDASDGFPRAALYDATNGALIDTFFLQQFATAGNISVFFVGGYCVVTYAQIGSAAIYANSREITPAIGSGWGPAQAVHASSYASTSGTYAAATNGTTVFICHEDSANHTAVSAYDSSLNFETTASLSNGGTFHSYLSMGAASAGNSLFIGVWASVSSLSSNACVFSANVPVGTINSFALLGGIAASASGFSLAIMWGLEAVSSVSVNACVCDNFTTWYVNFSSGVMVGVENTIFNVALASAPKTISGLTYVYLREDPSVASGGYYLTIITPGSTASTSPWLLAVLAPGIVSLPPAPGTGGLQVNLPALESPMAGIWETVLPLSRATAGRQGLDFFKLDTAAPFRYATSSLGKEHYLGGAYYDGSVLVEMGYPQTAQFTAASLGGSGSTYQYCVTMVRVDAAGNAEESAPSPVQTIASGSPPNVSIACRTACLTQKQRYSSGSVNGSIYFKVYRTPALASGDSNFYQVSPEPYPVGNANVQSASTVAIVDTAADATIQTHAVLYTVSGELAHDPPETFTHQTVHANRIWGIGADQRTIWYSQQYVDGLVPAFSRAAQITVDDADEPLVALASLHDRLLIFTKTKTYVLYGQGPSISGAGNDLQSPVRLPSEVGCVDPRSVVNTPIGVMFLSLRGIELISPDTSSTFIGLPVSLTTQAYPVCTSGALCLPTSTVRFTLCTADYPAAATGVTLLFDLRRNLWATHSLNSAAGTGPAYVSQAATWHARYGYVTGSLFRVARENTLADALPWLDFGTYFVPLSVTTAWLKAADLQGWSRVRRIRLLNTFFSPHALSVTLNYDYQIAANEAHAYSDLTINSIINGPREQVRIIPAQGKTEAVQLTIATSAPTTLGPGVGRGASLTGLALEVLAKRGGWRNFSPGGQT